MELVKADVRPFIKNPGEMDIWSTEYFMHVADMIRFEKQMYSLQKHSIEDRIVRIHHFGA